MSLSRNAACTTKTSPTFVQQRWNYCPLQHPVSTKPGLIHITFCLGGLPSGMHKKGMGLRGGLIGGWRGLPKQLGAVNVGYKYR